jgi:hypothetical protein
MALLGNGSVLHKSPGRFLNGFGTTGGGIASMRSAMNKHGMMRNAFEQFDPTAAIPNGYRSPTAWVPAKTAGGLSTKNSIIGSGGLSATIQAGYNIDGTITGSGGITDASLGLIVSIAATLVASGGISSAQVDALASMVATLTGSGDIEATAAGLASLGALITGSGDIDASNTALMDIAAEIVGYGALTPEGIRDAVWNAALSGYPTSGSAGNTLALAGSGGVDYTALGVAVWSSVSRTLTEGAANNADIADAVRANLGDELLRIVELAKIHGLVSGANLVVTPTSRVAGDVVQVISGNASSTTVSRS